MDSDLTTTAAAPGLVPVREKLLCPACKAGVVHRPLTLPVERDGLVCRLITLHAEEDTIIVCNAAWEAVPGWMREEFTPGKGRSLARRREAAREIREHLRTWG